MRVRAAAGKPLYRASDEHYQFKYLPASAFVFAPLAALPLQLAKACWFGLSVITLIYVVLIGVLVHMRVRKMY